MKRARQHRNPAAGFTLLELLLAMALGTIILLVGANLYRQATLATVLITARADMQQNARVAANSISRELNIAGTGIPNGGVAVPNTTGSQTPVFGCWSGGNCIPATQLNTNTYPNTAMYPVMPGYQQGITSISRKMSTITISYVDPLQPPDVNTAKTTTMADYTLAAFNTNGSTITINSNVNCTDNQRGLKVGDVLMMSNINGYALGVITGLSSSNRVVAFATTDPLHLNQAAGAGVTGNLASLLAGGTPASLPTTAVRVNIVTYYLAPDPGPDGTVGTADDGPPKLMRQVNANAPIPMAEAIEILEFTYDVFDDSVASPSENANQGNPTQLNQIRKVNLHVGARSLFLMPAGTYQRMSFYTAVSPRNLSFRDRYK